MIIRDANQNDRETYLKMAKAFYAGDATVYSVPPENFDAAFSAALQSDGLRILLLEDECNIIGYSVLAFFYSIEHGGKMVLLEELYMKPESRGKGYGKQFFDWIFEEYKQYAGYIMEVAKSNKGAIRLYTSLGFEEISYIRMRKLNK